MFQKEVLVLKEVKEDIELGKTFYDSIEPGVGHYFASCILADLESLPFYSGVHKKIFGVYQALSKRFPFGIYYEIKNETIIVVAILNMRQNPESIHKRLTR
ncbi:MAG: type II toxin-antitoxin system RelE/ParE family toxin [Kiritimatiellae bacterium]|nr:type II toxin-antitoxin system RelE/ParE family toxin [Kiritimatiellia bacterium]